MERVIKIKSIFAICRTCDLVLAETSEKDPLYKAIARRVVYESANRHKELAHDHSVVVFDAQEYARCNIPN